MSTPPELSVIVISWNTADVTLTCLKTIRRFLPMAQIVVVDNASTDDTVSKIKKIRIKNIKIKINTSNLGYAKACNLGANLAGGQYLLFLNSDIELIDDSLLKMLDYLKNHPNIGAIGPQFLNPDYSVQASVIPKQSISNAFKEFWLRIPSFSKYTPTSPSEVFAISGGALMISKKHFQQVDGWNENYFFYFEDLDLCRQLHKSNYGVYYYPQSRLIHRHGFSGSKLTDPQNQWRRLVPSSIIYHGTVKHYIINLIIWSGQKIQKIFGARF